MGQISFSADREKVITVMPEGEIGCRADAIKRLSGWHLRLHVLAADEDCMGPLGLAQDDKVRGDLSSADGVLEGESDAR